MGDADKEDGPDPEGDEVGGDRLDLSDAAHEAREIVDFTAAQVRDFRAFVGAIDSPFLLGLLLLLVAAGLSGVLIALRGAVRDWYMHLVMYCVLGLFVLLYIKAHYRAGIVRRLGSAASALVLICGFAYVLYDRISARRVWSGDVVIERAALPELWIPIGLLAATGVGLLLHVAVVGRYWRRPGRASAS
jgi:hypothetical protein